MKRRTGDTVHIAGDYQYNALTKGNPVQRFWHFSKQLSIREYLLPIATDDVIDVGCGSGVITSFLGEFASFVIGIDANAEAIQFSNSQFAKNNVEFRLGLVDEDFKINKLLDKIYCLELIEHIYVYQAESLLNIFHKLLKPGGKIFLTTPNYRSMWPIIEWGMDKLSLTPPLSEHQHVEFYHKAKLERLCQKAGFQIEVITTSCFIAPWVAPISWSLAKKISSIELQLPFYIGSILIAVLVKPE